MAKKFPFSYLSNKELIREYKHIKNRDPSSYNWTAKAKRQIIEEFSMRKSLGRLSKTAGVKKLRRSKGTSSATNYILG